MKIKDLIDNKTLTRFRIVRPDKTFTDFINSWNMGFMPPSLPLADADLNLTVSFITRLDIDDNNLFLMGDDDRDNHPSHLLFDPLCAPKFVIFTV